MSLRWRKNPRETGLRAIGARPRGYTLFLDGIEEIAYVNPNGGGWSSKQDGWYWVAFHGVTYMNTCKTPVATVEEAKAAAMRYIKQELKRGGK